MLPDNVIAFGCAMALKQEATQAALAAQETVHPQLRQMFAQSAQEAIQAQARVADYMIRRGYYIPPRADGANIGEVLQQLQAVIGQAEQYQPGAGMQVPTGAQAFPGYAPQQPGY